VPLAPGELEMLEMYPPARDNLYCSPPVVTCKRGGHIKHKHGIHLPRQYDNAGYSHLLAWNS
jgi:hypothetical protein